MKDRLKYQSYFDLFVAQSFYPKIIQPTRLAKKKGTLIDQTFCKFSDSIQESSFSGIILSAMSDHLPHFTCIDITQHKKAVPKYVKLNRKDVTSFNSFQNEIETQLANAHIPNDLITDPNNTYNTLDNIKLSAKRMHLQPTTVRFNKYRLKRYPWMIADILNSIKFRDKLYKRLQYYTKL